MRGIAVESLYETIQGLMHAGDIETIIELASVEEEKVVTALEKLGRPAPKIPPLQQLVVHPFDFVRRSAIYHLEKEMNPRWMLSLLAAKTLVVKIAQRYRSTVDMEDRTPELLPDALKHQSYAKQLAAVRAGKVPELGEQEIWPSIVPILNGDVAALAATYAHPKKPDPCEPIVAFSATCAAALSAEEAAMLKAFKAGTKPPKLDLTRSCLRGQRPLRLGSPPARSADVDTTSRSDDTEASAATASAYPWPVRNLLHS